MNTSPPTHPTFNQALKLWLKIGCISFGGPAGQIALMHKELVEDKRWISENRFLHALNYCMILPGPEAQQLATYIGLVITRSLGRHYCWWLICVAIFVIILAIGLAIYELWPTTERTGHFMGH